MKSVDDYISGESRVSARIFFNWQVRTYGCVLSQASFLLGYLDRLKDARAVRPYQSSGTAAWNLFHLWNHVDYYLHISRGSYRSRTETRIFYMDIQTTIYISNYYCPVKFLGRCRPEGPISYQPRATPWIGWLDRSRPEPKVADQREAKGKSLKFQCVISAFAPSGRNPRLTHYPGCYPGLVALSPFRGIFQRWGACLNIHPNIILIFNQILFKNYVYWTAMIPNIYYVV